MGKRDPKLICLKGASKGRGFVNPHYSPFTRIFMILVGSLYLKVAEGVKRVTVHNEKWLLDAFEKHYNKEERLILAFRHVAKEDAPVLMYALNRKLQRQVRILNKGKDKGNKITAHAQFLYGSDVLEWAGGAAAWLFPRIGCIPVINRSNNAKGLTLLRKSMQEGHFPVALAPESQVTYHMYKTFEISSGTASLALWGKNAAIVPIAIGYKHAKDRRTFIHQVIQKWEKETGLSVQQGSLYASLLWMTTKTIEILEQFYGIDKNGESTDKERIDHICEISMSKAESMARTKGNGSLLDRLFHVRHQGITAIRPEEFDVTRIAPVEHSIADLQALTAHLYLHHTQIVDVLQYIDPSYITLPCSMGRMSEYVLSLLDVINRIQGGNINSRFTPKGKDTLVCVGQPIHVHQKETNLHRREWIQIINEQVRSGLQTTSEELEKIWETEFYQLEK